MTYPGNVTNRTSASLVALVGVTTNATSQVSFAAPIVAAVFPTAGLPVQPGPAEKLWIQGEHFGGDTTELPVVRVSGVGKCLNVSRKSDSALSCLLPAGVGARHPVVVWAGQQQAQSLGPASPTIAFALPVVHTAAPAYALAGLRNATVVLRGRNLALRDSDIDAIRVGGVRCASWRVTQAARAVSCEGLDAPEVWPSPGTVEVVVGGQSTGAVSGVFEGVARPSVQAVSEAVLGPAGLWRAVLHGSALWRSSTAEDVANVTIGSGSGRLGAVAWHDPGAASGTLPGSYLGFDLPRGAAAGARVHVVSSAGLVSTGSVAVSFARISVESAWPDHLLAGEQNATVVLRGRNLALRDSDIDAIRVGGVRCASWRVTQAARAVSCEGLDAPEVWPSPGTVEVVVGGQSTGAVSGVFEGVARPSVQAILVAASGGAVRGAKVLLHGTGFGKRTSSISNVTFGGWPATSFRLLDHSAGLLEATLPAGVGSVQVRVVSATGLDSGALAAPSLLYAAPSVVRCEPPALLAGPKSQSLTIFGTNLGFKVTDVDSVEVEVFEAVPLPELLDASPRVVSPGTLISLQGRYFGKRHQDLAKWTWHGILASLTGSLSVGCTPEGPSSV
ncbi:hypothetical protein FNF29_06407 [Cafeteria roenbergensis]|uniref:IPT/TIG domain-containing protein n=1 Tax=Cafeteria roenbergensis TaxID=33653 RepID=A0A5A8C7W9_CAFRO|nr:hypothetical protein FNF29_06407 [Cafeteria roenbergensis]|eukprot:KAA0148935.1 hypothetical protein FNF29_06407 [Cafeteria roenbergensis]